MKGNYISLYKTAAQLFVATLLQLNIVHAADGTRHSLDSVNIEQEVFGTKKKNENQILSYEIVENIVKSDDVSYPAIFVKAKYFYDGSHGDKVYLVSTARKDGVSVGLSSLMQGPLSTGQGEISLMIVPMAALSFDVETNEVFLTMNVKTGDGYSKTIDQKLISFEKKWAATLRKSGSSKTDLDLQFESARRLLETGRTGNAEVARTSLEDLLAKDPNYVPAYVELARALMKTDKNFGPNSAALRKSENLLFTALKIDDKAPNTMVLLGYVQTHLKKYQEAEKWLKKAESIGTPNAWLQSNFGGLYIAMDEKEKAFKYYSAGMTKDVNAYVGNDRATRDSFEGFMKVAESLARYSEIDAALTQRYAQFPNQTCLQARKAENLLFNLRNYKFTLSIESMLRGERCSEHTRNVLALAYLSKWEHEEQGKSDGSALKQALIMNDSSSSLIVRISTSAFPQEYFTLIKKAGIDIDAINEHGMSPLASAISENASIKSISALLKAGANPNMLLNEQGWTPLLIAASAQNIEAIKELLKFKANKAARLQNGPTALEMAQHYGNSELIKVLSGDGV